MTGQERSLEGIRNLKRSTGLYAIVTLVSLLVATPVFAAFDIHRVGTPVIGREHDVLLDRWTDRQLTLWVGADDASPTVVLLFRADTSHGDAMVMIPYTSAVLHELQQNVSSAIEWAGIARKNWILGVDPSDVDTTKPLGCFGRESSQNCEKDGSAYDQGQVGMKFVAADGGQETDLVVSIVDRRNPLIKATLHIRVEEMKKLLANVEAIPSTLVKPRADPK